MKSTGPYLNPKLCGGDPQTRFFYFYFYPRQLPQAGESKQLTAQSYCEMMKSLKHLCSSWAWLPFFLNKHKFGCLPAVIFSEKYLK